MGKSNSNKFYDAQAKRTECSALAIIQSLSVAKESDILSALFVKVDDIFIKKLSRKIEYCLLDAKVNPNRFKETLHTALQSMAIEIALNNKTREFYEFCSSMYQEMHIKKIDNSISKAYYDMIIQLETYMSPVGTVVVGVTPNKELITQSELYPDYDRVIHEIGLKARHNKWYSEKLEKETVTAFRKEGYNVVNALDIDMLIMRERVVTSMQFNMVPFIKDKKSLLIDDNYLSTLNVNTDWGIRYHSTNELVAALDNRRRLLPKKGITFIDETDSSITGLFMQEVFVMDELYLLYKIDIKGSKCCGYYATKKKLFYSVFLDSSGSESIILNKRLKNYVLERYAVATTDINTDVDWVLDETEADAKTKKRGKLDRSKLSTYTTEVDAYIRKLPMGSSASEDAIRLAKDYGIKLNKDETFVRPFVKSVHKTE